MYIDSGGEVRACSWDAFGDSYLGNVFDEGVHNVWNGNRMMDLRNRIKNDSLKESEFCYGCKSRSHHGAYETFEEDFIIVKNSGMIYYNHK